MTSMRSTATPAALDHRAHLLARRDHAAVERRDVEAVEQQVEGLHLIVAQVGDDAAERRGDAGKARHQRDLPGRSP